MAPPSGGQSTPRTAANIVVVLCVFCGLLLAGCGLYGLITGDANRGVGLEVGLFAIGLIAALGGILLYCQVLLLHKFVSYSYRAYEALLASAELQRRQEEQIRSIAENASLSDWAKRIVYREKDFEFLRDTIHGAIVRQDWQTAEHLIRDVDTQFGYHEEATQLRQQLELARSATSEQRIAAAQDRFEKLCGDQNWAQAESELQRLRDLFPDDSRIVELSAELERRRDGVKTHLLKDYEQAVRNEDVERAHRLLFALDQYLVPAEVESLKKSARNVFRARLEQIKTRFSIAVSYKQWHNALAAGEQIVREFPNSGYAQEISKLMPTLRQRARKVPAASHAAPSADGADS